MQVGDLVKHKNNAIGVVIDFVVAHYIYQPKVYCYTTKQYEVWDKFWLEVI